MNLVAFEFSEVLSFDISEVPVDEVLQLLITYINE